VCTKVIYRNPTATRSASAAPRSSDRRVSDGGQGSRTVRADTACLGYLWAGDTLGGVAAGPVASGRLYIRPGPGRTLMIRCSGAQERIRTSHRPVASRLTCNRASSFAPPLPRMRSVRFPYDPRQHPIPAASAPPEGYLAWLRTRRHRALAWSGRPRSRPARGRSPAVWSQPALRS
jgi:hypothetical protein